MLAREQLLNKGPRLLLIDTDADDRALAANLLKRALPDAEVQEVGSAIDFARALVAAEFDLVVSEASLDWSDCVAVVAALVERRPGLAIIVFCGASDQQRAIAALAAGASDCVLKSSRGYLELPARVAAALTKRELRSPPANPHTANVGEHTLLERAQIGVFRATPDRRLLAANAAFLQLLGAGDLETARGVELPQLHFSAVLESEAQPDLQPGQAHRRQLHLHRADGGSRWVTLTEVLARDANGDWIVDGLVQDLTDAKQVEEALNKRLEELGRSNVDLKGFAYVASHELQEPLRMVEQYLRMVVQDAKERLDHDAQECIDVALSEARRMQALIRDLLTYARVDAEEATPAPQDCNRIVDRAVRNLRGLIEENDAEIRRDVLPMVLADGSQLVQLFQNLFSNAIKFRSEAPPRVQVSARREGEEWVFSVRDNGIGFEPWQGEQVFSLFKRLNLEHPGTGIGLAICKRIVERQSGRIWVSSEPGKGSTFFFSLPSPPGAPATSTAPAAARPEGSHE